MRLNYNYWGNLVYRQTFNGSNNSMTRYDDFGNKRSEKILHGENGGYDQYFYYPSGQMEKEQHFKNCCEQGGVWKWYSENGQVVETRNYDSNASSNQ